MTWQNRIRHAFDIPPDDGVVEELAQHARAVYDAARAEGYFATERHAYVRAGLRRKRDIRAALPR